MSEETLHTKGAIAHTFKKVATVLDYGHKKTLLGKTGSFILFLLFLLVSCVILSYGIAVFLVLTGMPFMTR